MAMQDAPNICVYVVYVQFKMEGRRGKSAGGEEVWWFALFYSWAIQDCVKLLLK